MLSINPRGAVFRSVFLFIGAAVICTGLAPIILRGDTNFPGWRGGMLFGPAIVLVGLFLVYVGVFKPEKLIKTRGKSKRRRA